MRKLPLLILLFPFLSWITRPAYISHVPIMGAEIETAIKGMIAEKARMFTRTAATYLSGEYMGVGVTSDGLGYVVTDAVGLFCNSAVSSGSGQANLIGTSTQMVLAVNNLHNANWLDINGHVWGGGEQCGNPYITGNNVYEENLDSAGNDRTFTAIANFWNNPDGEEGYTVGIETNGTLWICGDTRNGARGNGTAGADLQKWVQIPLKTNIVPRKVYGAFASFILCDTTTSGGTVLTQRLYSWSNSGGHAASLGYGSPGFGAGASSVSTYNVPTEVLLKGTQHAHNIKCVAGGMDCNYVIFDSAISGRADSVAILCWGTYAWRMCHTTSVGADPLNVPTDITTKIMTATVKAAVPGGLIDTIVTDNGSTHIIVANGATRVLVGWGSSEQGTLGTGLQRNFATFSTPYNDGGEDEFLGAVVQFTPVIICQGKTNWTTLSSNGYFGYYNVYQDANGDFFFTGRYKSFIFSMGVHPADFATGNLSGVMNCGWQFANFTRGYDPFANSAAPSIAQGCSNACVSGPTSNSQCSAISVTCFAIHAAISATYSGSTGYLTATSSTYAGVRLQHVLFKFVSGPTTPTMGIVDNPVNKTDTIGNLVPGTYTAKVVVTGRYFEADSTTVTFTVSGQSTFFFAAAGSGTACTSVAPCPLSYVPTAMGSVLPGDSLLFNSGDSYPGTTVISASGIFVGAYGVGADPQFAGPTTQTFTGSGANLTATCSGCTAATSLLVVDNIPWRVAQTPNATVGYYPTVVGSSSTTTVFATVISSMPNNVGDSIVLHGTYWTFKAKITAKAGSTITFSPAATDVPTGFLVLDGTPDVFGEFTYSGGTGGTFTADSVVGHVAKAATTDVALIITGSFDKIVGIAARYANKNLVQVTGQADSLIDDSLEYAGQDAINGNGQGLYVNGCYINHCLNSGINQASVGANTNSWNIQFNTIDHIGLITSAGQNGSGQTLGIAAPGSGVIVKWNILRNLGFNAVYFGGGDSIFIQRNYTNGFCLYKIDGAAYYGWRNSGTATNIHVDSNIAFNGGGPHSYDGVVQTAGIGAWGYYWDSHSNGISATANLSWHMSAGGWLNHGPNNSFTNGIIGDNGYAGALNSEFAGGPTITGVVFSGNTVYGDSTADALYRLATVNADITTMQTATGNTYVHSSITNAFWTKSNTDGGTNRNLAGYQSNTGGESGSTFQNLTLQLVANTSFAPAIVSFPYVGLYNKIYYRNKISLPTLSGTPMQLINPGTFWRYRKKP